MNKPFNIHDWQDKQKRSLFEQEELGPKSPKLDLIVDRILNVTGGRLATWQLKETIKSSHDMMGLYERDKEKMRMMIYNLLRDDYARMEEASMTGTGASVSAGSGEAYATPHAFKKKRNRDND